MPHASTPLGQALHPRSSTRPSARRVKEAIVQCKDFRCLAHLDSDGKWRNSATGQELSEVLQIVSLVADYNLPVNPA